MLGSAKKSLNLGSKASQEPLGTQGNNKAESYVVLKQLFLDDHSKENVLKVSSNTVRQSGEKNQNQIKNKINTRMFTIHMLNETRTLGDIINVLMLIRVVRDIYALDNKDCNKGLRTNHI